MFGSFSPIRLARWSSLVMLVLSLSLPSTLHAATPSSGAMSPTSQSLTWSGGPFTDSTLDPTAADCSNSTCDDFIITVTGTDPGTHSIRANVTWTNPTNDLDVHVYNNLTGSELDVDGQAVGNTESVVWIAGPGEYRVTVLVYRAVAESYTATATLETAAEPEPPNALRPANYQLFDFGFTPEVELPEQRRSQITNQDVEPEIEVDRFGTIYIGAIRGVPGGVDLWRSDDGGAAFQYLGEPDGTQNPSPAPNEAGAGGGDVDLSLGDPFYIVPPVPGVTPGIMSTGRLYCSSLWLGSATMSVSVDRGENFVAVPFTTAQLDRQWHVARGEKTLYMSLRKLAQLQAGQHSVYVTQSDDGGVTFPKGTFVQDPLVSGVPEDLAGNIVLTSDGALIGSFVSRDGRDLYVYRAPRGNAPGPSDLPPGPLDVPLFTPDTFDAGKIFHGTRGVTANNKFPIMAVDRADNLHLVFGDRHLVYLMSCPAGADPTRAESWTLPVALNAPAVAGFEFTRTAVMPWIAAGAAGKVSVIWYGTDVEGDADTPLFEQMGVPWRLVYAQVEDALAPTPTVYLDVASTQGGGVIHTGQICQRGLGCPSGTRELAEYSSLTLDRNGFANIAYAGTLVNGAPPGGPVGAITFFTKTTQRPLTQEPVRTFLACDDPSISRHGGWHTIDDARAHGGHYCRNVGAGHGNGSAYLEFSFEGEGIDLQIARGPRGGNAEIFLDGTSRGTVDFWRAPSSPQHPDNSGRDDLTFGEFVSIAAAPGTHTFRLEVRNSSPDTKRDMIYLDGIVVTSGGATGQGNPTETASASEGMSGLADPLGGVAGAVTKTLSAPVGTALLTGVLEMDPNASLDLLLVNPLGATVGTSLAAGQTEVIRYATALPGLYKFLVVNRGTQSAPYRLDLIRTHQTSGSAAASALPSSSQSLARRPGESGTVFFTTGKTGRAGVRIFDVTGRLVRAMSVEVHAEGAQLVPWDARGDQGERVPSGVYYYKVTHPDGSESADRTIILR